jgi:uncharacterized coiled-coil protein SlyX
MSVQSDIRNEDRRNWEPVVVHRGAGAGTTVIALMALLAALAALVVPVGAPLLDLFMPDNPAVKALNRDSRALRDMHAAIDGMSNRVTGQNGRQEAVEQGVTALAERVGRLEGLAQAPAPAPHDNAAAEADKVALGETNARLSALETGLGLAIKRIDTLDTSGSNGKGFSARVDAVEARVGELSTAVTEQAGHVQETAARVAALPARFDEASARMAAADTLVTALGRRLEALEVVTNSANGANKSLRLGVSLLQLNNVVQSHRPFARELALVVRLWQPAAPSGDIEVLASSADAGVATVAELRDSFSVILAPKLRATAAGNEKPMVDRVRMWFASFIAPEVKSAKANPVELIVDATIEKLAEEDLRGAVEHLAGLDATLAPLTTRWLVEAKNRIAVDRAMDTLLSMSVEDLTRPN